MTTYKQGVHADLIKEFHKSSSKALRRLALTTYIDHGTSRTVFGTDMNANIVLKMSNEQPAPIANTIEYSIYEEFKDTKEGKRWLAECHDLRDQGHILIQERLTIITSKHDRRLPKKIPNWLTDTKVTNWGVTSDGIVKCCDYASALLLQDDPWGLKVPEWWELTGD